MKVIIHAVICDLHKTVNAFDPFAVLRHRGHRDHHDGEDDAESLKSEVEACELEIGFVITTHLLRLS